MLNRRADTMKGSYYANPVLDVPNVSVELRQAYPEYYGKNICKLSYNHIIVFCILILDPGPTVTPEVGDFEQAFKDLGG